MQIVLFCIINWLSIFRQSIKCFIMFWKTYSECAQLEDHNYFVQIFTSIRIIIFIKDFNVQIYHIQHISPHWGMPCRQKHNFHLLVSAYYTSRNVWRILSLPLATVSVLWLYDWLIHIFCIIFIFCFTSIFC